MPVSIAPIAHADIPGAISCIQTSFAQDPYFLWAFPSRANFNAARNQSSLRTRCLWGMRHALFHVAKDPLSSTPERVLGVACWLPPAIARPAPPPPSWAEYFLSWASPRAWATWGAAQVSSWSLWFGQLATNVRHGGRGGLDVRRYWLWKERQAQAQEELWDDEKGYYFCNIVTVLPEAQGKGVGRVLMRYVTDMADAEGRRCYLESSRDEPNIKIYETMGFKLVRTMDCRVEGEKDGITLYCMTREPVVRP